MPRAGVPGKGTLWPTADISVAVPSANECVNKQRGGGGGSQGTHPKHPFRSGTAQSTKAAVQGDVHGRAVDADAQGHADAPEAPSTPRRGPLVSGALDGSWGCAALHQHGPCIRITVCNMLVLCACLTYFFVKHANFPRRAPCVPCAPHRCSRSQGGPVVGVFGAQTGQGWTALCAQMASRSTSPGCTQLLCHLDDFFSLCIIQGHAVMLCLSSISKALHYALYAHCTSIATTDCFVCVDHNM